MRNATIISLGAMALVLSAADAAAQTVAGSETPQASEPAATSSAGEGQGDIVVTANKRTERLNDVPAAIAVVSGGTLAKGGISQFAEYFDRVPGLQALDAGQPGHAIVSIRGISTGAGQANATVGTYINDIPFGSSGGIAIGGRLSADPSTFDIDRIEVLKGPQGTLYGASTLGGLIKTVYTAPVFGQFAGRVMLDGSTVEDGNSGYMTNAMLNVPIGDRVAVRGVLSYRRDPGFIDSVTPGNTARNWNTGKAFGTRLMVGIKPTDEFSIQLLANYQNTRSDAATYEDVDPTTLRPLFGDLQTGRTYAQPSDRLRYQIYSARLSYDFGFASLTSVTGLGKYNDDQVLDYTGRVHLGPIIPYAQTLYLRNLTQEVRLASPDGKRFEWLIGGFYSDQKNRWDFTENGLDATTRQPIVPTYEYYTFNAHVTYKEKAAFANATYNLSAKLSVTGGLRYSANDQSYVFFRRGISQGGQSTSTASSSDHVVTYAASAQYKISPNNLVYVKVSSGYRPGGPQPNNLVGLGLPTSFKPDTVTNYEGGLKLTLADRKLTVNASGFYIDWRDIQLNQNATVLINGSQQLRGYIGNAGRASSRGADLELTYHPTRRLTLGGSGAYTDARIDQDSPVIGAKAGERLPYSPRWSFNGTADYYVPLSDITRLNFGGDVRYIGSRTNYFSADPSRNVQATMPSYAIADIHLGVKRGPYDITFRINNITNKRAILAATTGQYRATAPAIALVDYAVVNQPRTYGLTLTADF